MKTLSTLAGFFFVAVGLTLGDGSERLPDRTVETNGVTLQYLDWHGNGPAMILLPDFGIYGGSARDFEQIAPMLNDRFHVLALTPRSGMAVTARPAGISYDTSTRVEDLRGFLDALHIDKAVLVGVGSAADDLTLFATRYPQRADRLIYISPADLYAKHPEVFADQPNQPPWIRCLLQEVDGSPEAAQLKAALVLKPKDEDWAVMRAVYTAAYTYHRDYAAIQAPALLIARSPEKNIPQAQGSSSEKPEQERAIQWWKEHVMPLERAAIEDFRQQVKRGKVVELNFGSDDVLRSSWFEVVPQMRLFLLGERLPHAAPAVQSGWE